MGNPLFRKQARMVFGTLLGIFFALGFMTTLSFGDSGALIYLLFCAGCFYLGFGLDIQRINKAKSRIGEYMQKHQIKDNLLLIDDVYLKDHGRGFLALTEHWLYFVDKKDSVLEFNLHNLNNFGYKHIGTGSYATTYHNVGPMRVASTAEGKVPIFYIEISRNNKDFLLAFYSAKHKKFYKVLDKNWETGTLSKERKEAQKEQQQLTAMRQRRNEVILECFNEIMDPELNRLDQHTRLLLQNGKVYEDALYALYKKQMPKLYALNESEDHLVRDFFGVCTIRGSRTAIAVLLSEGYEPSEQDKGIIFSEEQLEGKYDSVGVVDYPALEQIAYAQYGHFRNSNHHFLSEKELLSMSKEFIRVGFKNTMSNYIALKEYKQSQAVNVFQ